MSRRSRIRATPSLYAMLCKVRRTLKTRLGDVLGKGFGYDRQSGNPPMLFSGCYFAATGPKSDRQAFVSGLLSKLYDEQEDIEWTEDALREDRRRGWLTRIGWLALCLFSSPLPSGKSSKSLRSLGLPSRNWCYPIASIDREFCLR